MSFFATLHKEIVEAAARCGLTAREAVDMAQSVEERLRRDYKGQHPYATAGSWKRSMGVTEKRCAGDSTSANARCGGSLGSGMGGGEL